MPAILYVDDEPDLLELGKAYLEENTGFSVTTLSSATEALSYLGDHKVDAIISDYYMPGMDGIKFLKEVRARNDATPFIIFTGRGREEVIIEALNSGADFYLQKGGDPEPQFTELINQVHHAIARRQAEEGLRKTQEQLFEAMDLANLANWEFDVGSGIFTFNDRFYNLYGTTAEREGGYQMPAGVYAREFVYPGERELVATEVANAIAATDPNYTRRVEHRIIRRDGEVRHIVVRFGITKDAEGRTIRSHGANQDITDQKRAEETIKRHLKEISSYYDNAPIGLAVLDTGLRYIRINRSLAELNGIPAEAHIGRTVREIIPSMADEAERLAAEIIRTGRPIVNIEVTGESKSQPGIRRTWREGWFPFTEENGNLIGFSVIAEEITEKRQAEEALRDSRERMSSTLKAAHAGSWDWDIPSGRLTWSPEFFDLFGLPRDAPPSFDTWLAAIVQDDRDAAMARIDDAIAGKRSLWNEYRIIGPGGQVRWIGASGSTTYDVDDRPLRMSGICIDITDRKRAEDALRESEERYRSLFNNMLDGFAYCKMLYDEEGRPVDFMYLEVNCAFERLTGLKNVAGKRVTEVIPGVRELSPQIFEIYGRVARTGEYEEFELDFKPLDRWLYISVFSIEKDHFVAVFDDITEQKQTTELLRKERDFAESIIRTAQTIVLILTPTGTIAYINPYMEAISGYLLAEVKGRDWFDLFVPARSREATRSLFLNAIRDIHTHGNLDTIVIRDGRELLIEWYDTTLKGPDDRIEGLLAIGQDVTEKMMADAALRKVNQQLNLLSTITRHDILNQLMVLKGQLSLSLKAIDDPPALREYIKKEMKVADVIERQIQFTREYQDLGTSSPAWQDLNASISQAAAILPLGDTRIERDPNNPEIFADPLFDKVFYNLIDNSLRHGGNHLTTIRISSQESGQGLTIVFEDDGVGISPEIRERLFTWGGGKEIGDGLFLIREILAITGITIDENGKPGEGARFEITVPKKDYRLPSGE